MNQAWANFIAGKQLSWRELEIARLTWNAAINAADDLVGEAECCDFGILGLRVDEPDGIYMPPEATTESFSITVDNCKVTEGNA